MTIRVSQVDNDDAPAKLAMAEFLHRLFRLGAIPQNDPGRAIKALIVATRDDAHGVGIAPDDEPRVLDIAQMLVVQRELGHAAVSRFVNAVASPASRRAAGGPGTA